jgi:MFS family permease
MFGVDAFIVNVAMPTMAVELRAGAAQIEAVIAIYLIAYATLVVSGGRLGDIYGTKNVFIAGVSGFTVTSLWCGLAQSGPELILARLAQGATAALMVPQVLATLHLWVVDSSRARARHLRHRARPRGAAGFMLGGLLVTLDLAGLGWRAVFFVNVPFGAVIIAAALKIVPTAPRRAGTRLDIPGAIVLFAGLLCLIGPLLFGHDLHWSYPVWLVMAAGVAIVAAFPRLERAVARRGGMPLIDLSLLSDAAFMRGLIAVFFFFFANLSFYLVMTMFMQKVLLIPPLSAGLVFVPPALTFVIASRHSGVRAKHRGTLVLIEGCVVQIIGLAMLAAAVACTVAPSASRWRADGARLELDEAHADDLLDAVARAAAQRGDGSAVRIEVERAMPPVLRQSAQCSLRLKPLDRRGWRFMRRALCLRCRLLFAAYFCHGCDARQTDHTLTSIHAIPASKPAIPGYDRTRTFYFALQQLSVDVGRMRHLRSCCCP